MTFDEMLELTTSPVLTGPQSKFYKGIFAGWFDFHDLYERAVARARPDSLFVECGVFLGASAAFLRDRLDEVMPSARLHLVDRWIEYATGCTDPATHTFLLAQPSFRNAFDQCARHLQLDRRCRIRQGDAIRVLRTYEDQSIDFAFLDDCHEYGHVFSEIETALPKIKVGGVLAGHDYQMDDVSRAVRDTLGAVQRMNNSWWFEKT